MLKVYKHIFVVEITQHGRTEKYKLNRETHLEDRGDDNDVKLTVLDNADYYETFELFKSPFEDAVWRICSYRNEYMGLQIDTCIGITKRLEKYKKYNFSYDFSCNAYWEYQEDNSVTINWLKENVSADLYIRYLQERGVNTVAI